MPPRSIPTTLAEMEKGLAGATGLILPGSKLDVVAYGCTSGTVVIGEEQVFARIREARPEVACTTPITAAIAGLKALGAKRIALLTPYIEEVNQMFRGFIEARGIEVPVMGSFNHENDIEVARITEDSIRAAVRRLVAAGRIDAVFVSCTSLRVAAIAESLEREVGRAGDLEQSCAGLALPAPRRLSRAGGRLRQPVPAAGVAHIRSDWSGFSATRQFGRMELWTRLSTGRGSARRCRWPGRGRRSDRRRCGCSRPPWSIPYAPGRCSDRDWSACSGR